MFWRVKNERKQPIGVQISIELNAGALDRVARTSNPPTTEGMLEAWLKENCTKIVTGIAAINGAGDSVLFIDGSNAKVYRNLDFQIALPFPIGQNRTETIQVTATADLIFFSFEEIAIMAIPIRYILKSLIGEPFEKYTTADHDMFGESKNTEITITSPDGQYYLPIIETVAKDWLKYNNTAAQITASSISTIDDFPLELGIRID